MPKVSFNSRNTEFYTELKKSVDKYFTDNKIKKTGNWKLYLKAASLVPAAIALYIILLTIDFSVVPGIVLSSLLGFILASVGFNIMHDACHGSYSSKKWL